MDWRTLEEGIQNCRRCGLCGGRTHAVPGEGSRYADVMFVGEGPGAEEDRLGRPFVGAAGQLLTRMIEALDWQRDDVYIANIVKCRPPGNRDPLPEEAEACLPWLREQYRLIRPKVLVCLGRVAAQKLIAPNLSITRERGKWVQKAGLWIMPTFHPSALLRTQSLKRDAWQDFQAVRDKLRELTEGEPT